MSIHVDEPRQLRGGESGLSARMIARRLSLISGLYAHRSATPKPTSQERAKDSSPATQRGRCIYHNIDALNSAGTPEASPAITVPARRFHMDSDGGVAAPNVVAVDA